MMHRRGAGADELCPCGSGKAMGPCCGRLHSGGLPPSPEALMRSRYSAYAVGDADYILATTHPKGPLFRTDIAVWRREVAAFCSLTEFLELVIHDAGFEEPTVGWVEFTARLERDGRDVSMRERSRFTPDRGKWRYLDGEPRPL